MTEESEEEALEAFLEEGMPEAGNVAGETGETVWLDRDGTYGMLRDDAAGVDAAGRAPEEVTSDTEIDYDGVLRDIDEMMERLGYDLVVAEDLGAPGARFAYENGHEEAPERVHFTLNRNGELVALTYTVPQGEVWMTPDNPQTSLETPIYEEENATVEDILAGEVEPLEFLPVERQPDYPDPADDSARLKDDRGNTRYH
ncbi:MAG: hypothetical protein SVQ76_02010 [Candidatus Nanohaloarchaea archaeon]|nr:hypothetical protein [Candidatus Nanohaloarchaea archaeon]